MSKSDTRYYMLQILAVVIFVAIPFVHINHTAIYIFLELICLYGLWNFDKKLLADTFFRYYLWFLVWGVVVTFLSVKPLMSFKGLTTILVPPLLLFGLADGRLLKHIHKLLLLCSLILFLISISFYLTVFLHINSPLLQLIDNLGGGRITSSTLVLCIIVYTLFFNHSIKNKSLIIALNIISGVILRDSAFIFTLGVAGFLYWATVVRRVRIYKIVISVILIIVVTQFVLINILHYNLHIYERMHIYSYWLDKVFYSPFYGVGLSLKLESWFYTTTFPIPPEIYKMDNNIALHAHNYFLDLLLQTGVIGVIIILVFFYKIGKAAYRQDSKYGQAVLFMLLVIIMKNLVDDEIDGSRGLIYWLFITMTYTTVMNKFYLQQDG